MTLRDRLNHDDPFEAADALHETSEAALAGQVPALIARLLRVEVGDVGEGTLAALIVDELARVTQPGDEAVSKALEQVAQVAGASADDAQLELHVVDAVRVLRPAWAVPWLAARFFDDDDAWPFFVGPVGAALAELGGAQTAASFVAALDAPADEETEFDRHLAAVRALGQLRHAPALPVLERLTRHQSPAVADAARDALLLLRPQDRQDAVTTSISALTPTSPLAAWERAAALVREYRPGIEPLMDKVDEALAAPKTPSFEWLQRAVWLAAVETAPELAQPRLRAASADPARSLTARLSAGLLSLDVSSLPTVLALLDLARQADQALTSGDVGAFNLLHVVFEHELSPRLVAAGETSELAKTAIARSLDELRRGPQALPETSQLRRLANEVIARLTGIERFSQFDVWLRGRPG